MSRGLLGLISSNFQLLDRAQVFSLLTMACKDVYIAAKEAAAGFATARIQRVHMHIPLHCCENEPEAGYESLVAGLASNHENILIIDRAKGRKLPKIARVSSQVYRVEVTIRLNLEQVATFNALTDLEDSIAINLAGCLEQHAMFSSRANESYLGTVAKNLILPGAIMR